MLYISTYVFAFAVCTGQKNWSSISIVLYSYVAIPLGNPTIDYTVDFLSACLSHTCPDVKNKVNCKAQNATSLRFRGHKYVSMWYWGLKITSGYYAVGLALCLSFPFLFLVSLPCFSAHSQKKILIDDVVQFIEADHNCSALSLI